MSVLYTFDPITQSEAAAPTHLFNVMEKYIFPKTPLHRCVGHIAGMKDEVKLAWRATN